MRETKGPLDALSKNLADGLRAKHPDIKASHARELAARFLGYKTHAALLCGDTVRQSIDVVDRAKELGIVDGGQVLNTLRKLI